MNDPPDFLLNYHDGTPTTRLPLPRSTSLNLGNRFLYNLCVLGRVLATRCSYIIPNCSSVCFIVSPRVLVCILCVECTFNFCSSPTYWLSHGSSSPWSLAFRAFTHCCYGEKFQIRISWSVSLVYQLCSHLTFRSLKAIFYSLGVISTGTLIFLTWLENLG